MKTGYFRLADNSLGLGSVAGPWLATAVATFTVWPFSGQVCVPRPDFRRLLNCA
jgi:hypothetical protein